MKTHPALVYENINSYDGLHRLENTNCIALDFEFFPAKYKSGLSPYAVGVANQAYAGAFRLKKLAETNRLNSLPKAEVSQLTTFFNHLAENDFSNYLVFGLNDYYCFNYLLFDMKKIRSNTRFHLYNIQPVLANVYGSEGHLKPAKLFLTAKAAGIDVAGLYAHNPGNDALVLYKTAQCILAHSYDWYTSYREKLSEERYIDIARELASQASEIKGKSQIFIPSSASMILPGDSKKEHSETKQEESSTATCSSDNPLAVEENHADPAQDKESTVQDLPEEKEEPVEDVNQKIQETLLEGKIASLHESLAGVKLLLKQNIALHDKLLAEMKKAEDREQKIAQSQENELLEKSKKKKHDKIKKNLKLPFLSKKEKAGNTIQLPVPYSGLIASSQLIFHYPENKSKKDLPCTVTIRGGKNNKTYLLNKAMKPGKAAKHYGLDSIPETKAALEARLTSQINNGHKIVFLVDDDENEMAVKVFKKAIKDVLSPEEYLIIYV